MNSMNIGADQVKKLGGPGPHLGACIAPFRNPESPLLFLKFAIVDLLRLVFFIARCYAQRGLCHRKMFVRPLSNNRQMALSAR